MYSYSLLFPFIFSPPRPLHGWPLVITEEIFDVGHHSRLTTT